MGITGHNFSGFNKDAVCRKCGKYHHSPKQRVVKTICVSCGKVIISSPCRSRKTCSRKCWNLLISKRKKETRNKVSPVSICKEKNPEKYLKFVERMKQNNPMSNPLSVEKMVNRKREAGDYKSLSERNRKTARGGFNPILSLKSKDKEKYEKFCISVSERLKKNNHLRTPEGIRKAMREIKKLRDEEKFNTYHPTEIDKEKSSIRMKKNNPMFNEETIEKRREWLKNHPEVFKKALQDSRAFPNGLERKFIQLFSLANLPVDYVGDFKFPIGDKIIGYRYPDFKVRNQNKVIEVYSPDWGKWFDKRITRRYNNYEQNRKDFFKKFGYDSLFLTDEELKDTTNLIQKVEEFIFRPIFEEKSLLKDFSWQLPFLDKGDKPQR